MIKGGFNMKKKVFEDVKITILLYQSNILLLSETEYEGPGMKRRNSDLLGEENELF